MTYPSEAEANGQETQRGTREKLKRTCVKIQRHIVCIQDDLKALDDRAAGRSDAIVNGVPPLVTVTGILDDMIKALKESL